ncbi:molybdopterin-binding protein [Rhodobacteraceae bacterium KMM 6894]|nr:molybdopterin-binding protein [Rhodobacteraceae bacterium KMM 6894]
MKFGAVPLAKAEGGILAHSVATPNGRLRKGLVLDAAHIAQLEAAGLSDVVIARLDADDLHENIAAATLAQALAENAPAITLTRPFTGRVNLIADAPGVVVLDVAALHAANAVHPMITVATVPHLHQSRPKGLIATVKIIAYGVPQKALNEAAQIARGAIRLATPQLRTASLIITDTPGGPGDKGQDAIAARLEALNMTLGEVLRVSHDEAAIAGALNCATGDLVLILTASATSDVHDTAPAALRSAGGAITRFGMPVDPGNLLFLGHLGSRPVIGLPGCARAPALNGADWVLARIACGLEVSSADIAGMGVGGLLKEIPTRPMPRRSKQ